MATRDREGSFPRLECSAPTICFAFVPAPFPLFGSELVAIEKLAKILDEADHNNNGRSCESNHKHNLENSHAGH
jgi:hypothetical protein